MKATVSTCDAFKKFVIILYPCTFKLKFTLLKLEEEVASMSAWFKQAVRILRTTFNAEVDARDAELSEKLDGDKQQLVTQHEEQTRELLAKSEEEMKEMGRHLRVKLAFLKKLRNRERIQQTCTQHPTAPVQANGPKSVSHHAEAEKSLAGSSAQHTEAGTVAASNVPRQLSSELAKLHQRNSTLDMANAQSLQADVERVILRLGNLPLTSDEKEIQSALTWTEKVLCEVNHDCKSIKDKGALTVVAIVKERAAHASTLVKDWRVRHPATSPLEVDNST
ncbi:hypothetical protein V5O48_019036 [Marasmius crinis-equi]|uniref:Uncharacterized protein n=1 Tax=Marasmius crinis-equi TaxID=585013 RepID=A0ABR3EJL2_9AGAR